MPCAPGDVRAISKITKEGKSISFTEAKLFQNDKLIAISTATNKIVPTKI
jgi:acyl-coenzyme A thioesterase PaaI-like protein